jgi:competence protein ComEC
MSIIANILAAPVVAPITIVGFVAALISPISAPISELLIWLVKPLAQWITWTAQWSSTFPVFTLKTGLYGFIAALLLALTIYIGRVKALIALLVIVIGFSWVQRFPAGDWQIANCDIGQGDALVLNLKNDRAILIDVGPEPQLIDRCLRQLGIKEIPLIVLTHGHADHIGGLAGAKKNRKIGQIWFGNVFAGTRARVGDIDIDVKWPMEGSENTPNNSRRCRYLQGLSPRLKVPRPRTYARAITKSCHHQRGREEHIWPSGAEHNLGSDRFRR